MMWGRMYDGGWGMGWSMFGLLHGLLWLVLIVMAIVVLARWLCHGHASTPGSAESAPDILKKRYDRGKIGKAEYEEKKRDLSM